MPETCHSCPRFAAPGRSRCTSCLKRERDTVRAKRAADPDQKRRHRLEMRRYRATHPDHVERHRAHVREFYRREAERLNRKRRAAYLKRHRPEAYEARLVNRARWATENPETLKRQWAKRQARKVGVGGSFSAAEYREKLERYAGRCWYCQRRKATHADHFWPLASGVQNGNAVWNIVPACAACNLRKGASPPAKFLARKPLHLRPVQEVEKLLKKRP